MIYDITINLRVRTNKPNNMAYLIFQRTPPPSGSK